MMLEPGSAGPDFQNHPKPPRVLRVRGGLVLGTCVAAEPIAQQQQIRFDFQVLAPNDPVTARMALFILAVYH